MVSQKREKPESAVAGYNRILCWEGFSKIFPSKKESSAQQNILVSDASFPFRYLTLLLQYNHEISMCFAFAVFLHFVRR